MQKITASMALAVWLLLKRMVALCGRNSAIGGRCVRLSVGGEELLLLALLVAGL